MSMIGALYNHTVHSLGFVFQHLVKKKCEKKLEFHDQSCIGSNKVSFIRTLYIISCKKVNFDSKDNSGDTHR